MRASARSRPPEAAAVASEKTRLRPGFFVPAKRCVTLAANAPCPAAARAPSEYGVPRTRRFAPTCDSDRSTSPSPNGHSTRPGHTPSHPRARRPTPRPQPPPGLVLRLGGPLQRQLGRQGRAPRGRGGFGGQRGGGGGGENGGGAGGGGGAGSQSWGGAVPGGGRQRVGRRGPPRSRWTSAHERRDTRAWRSQPLQRACAGTAANRKARPSATAP